MMERPAELLDLLNPVCCALFLRKAIDGYARESQSGLPYALSMLVLPFVLHKRTREALPARLTTTLAVWTQRNPELLLELPRRLHTLDAYYREAMIWGLARK